MQQNMAQIDRPVLRMGSIAFLAGVVIIIVSTLLHPSRQDPSNQALVFIEYANSDSWITVHIGQFAGGIVVFAGGICSSISLAFAIRIPGGFHDSMYWFCYSNNDS
jgi:hypothetical protein